MCDYADMPINLEYMNDVRRGRIAHPERFSAIFGYAKERWLKSRDLRWSRRWEQVMDAAKRRSPWWSA